jgi:glycolate oxidase
MASGLENEYVTLHEIVKAAKVRLNGNIWDYLIGATETETTMRRNRMALDSIAFKPRVLRNVSTIDPSSEIFGKKLRIPSCWRRSARWNRSSPAAASRSPRAPVRAASAC